MGRSALHVDRSSATAHASAVVSPVSRTKNDKNDMRYINSRFTYLLTYLLSIRVNMSVRYAVCSVGLEDVEELLGDLQQALDYVMMFDSHHK